MNSIFNFLDNSLNSLDRVIHSAIKDTFADNFIHELQGYLEKCHSYELFKQLPKNTYFHLTGYDNNFLECMAYGEKKIYYVPKDVISGEMPKLGEALACVGQGKLAVNYGGIPLWEHQIPEFKNECTIAK